MRRMPINNGASQQVKLYMTLLTYENNDDNIHFNINILSNFKITNINITDFNGILAALNCGENSKKYFVSGGIYNDNDDFSLGTANQLEATNTKLYLSYISYDDIWGQYELHSQYDIELNKSIEL